MRASILLAALGLAMRAALAAPDGGLPPLPPLPQYPPPLTTAGPDTRGEIHLASTSPVDFAGILRDGELQTPTTVPATLRLPEGAGAGRSVPAMVILHGSGGIHAEREHAYGELLSAHGVATLVVDSYAGRGVSSETPYALRVLAVTVADEVADAYAALKLLATHPAIDASRIGVMGFSYGGMATRATLDGRIQARLGAGAAAFALHVDFYGPCYFDLRTPATTGAPYYSLRGGQDASNDLRDCAVLEHRLRQAGSLAGTHVYSGAGHGWELHWERRFYDTLNPAPCRLVLDPEGRWQLDDELLPWSPGLSRPEKHRLRAGLLQRLSTCMAPGYIVGRDEAVDEHARRQVLEIVSRHLGS